MNYNPFDPEGMANLIKKGYDIEKAVGHWMANEVINTGATQNPNQKRPPKSYEESNPRNQRNDKGVKRGPQKRTIEKNNMSKEDININNIKKNNTPNIINNNNTTMSRRINSDPDVNGREEIAIIPVPRNVSNIIPDVFNIKMKCRTFDALSVVKGTNTFDSLRISMNDLNSPFANTPTFDYLGTSQWKSLFQFYRIISNDITIRVTNVTNSNDVETGDFIEEFQARVGMEFTDSATARLDTSRKMAEGKHNVSTVLNPAGGYGGNGSQYTFKHHYEPAQFINKNSHISNNSEEDKWTAIAASPTHPHYCHVGLVENFNLISVADSTITVILDITAEVTVQWREVTDNILTESQTS